MKHTTIKEKAEIARDALNQAALVMTRQMESGELDKQAADVFIDAAERKAKACHNAYFAKNANLRQLEAARLENSIDELIAARDKFSATLKQYAKAVGARFVETKRTNNFKGNTVINSDKVNLNEQGRILQFE